MRKSRSTWTIATASCWRVALRKQEAYRKTLEEISEEKLLAKGLERVEHQAPQEPVVLGAREKRNILAGLWQDTRYGLRSLAPNQPGQFAFNAKLTRGRR